MPVSVHRHAPTTSRHIGSRAALRWSRTALLFLALAAALTSRAQSSREYDLKAVFLYNFASFIEWPKSAFPQPNAPFLIGLLGDDPFGRSLDEVVAGEQVNGHPIVVRRYADLQQLRAQPPHILFICSSEKESMADVIKLLSGTHVLTVSEVPGFLRSGGAINFTTSNRVQLSINPDAAKQAGLTVSSKLLRIAQSSPGESIP